MSVIGRRRRTSNSNYSQFIALVIHLEHNQHAGTALYEELASVIQCFSFHFGISPVPRREREHIRPDLIFDWFLRDK